MEGTMINDDGNYVCDFCRGASGEFSMITGNHVSCEEVDRLEKENKALRSLLKEVETDSVYWYEKYFLIPGAHENITMVIDAVASRHLALMEKLNELIG